MPKEKERLKKRPKGKPPVYPFSAIRLGGEVFIPTDQPRKVGNAAREYAKYHDLRFKTETDPERGGIWVIRPRPRR
ncbi:hypothetical protein GCM10027347_59670 [Larkinella harenae]